MSQSLNETLEENIFGITDDINEQRLLFDMLAKEDPDLPIRMKGLDIAKKVIKHLDEGTPLAYPPIVEAFFNKELSKSPIVPIDSPINSGLFSGLGVEEKPSESVGGFVITATIEPVKVEFEPIFGIADFKSNEYKGLGARASNFPLLRAVRLFE